MMYQLQGLSHGYAACLDDVAACFLAKETSTKWSTVFDSFPQPAQQNHSKLLSQYETNCICFDFTLVIQPTYF